MNDKTTTVSLVLGAGGARGLAHIGVIRQLTARNCRIRAISGCSMGALVGGIYAFGELDTFTDWVVRLKQADIVRMLDWTFSGGGVIRGNKLMNQLREFIGERNIEDLSLDYTAVAVDIEKGKEVWLSDGPLFDAIRASIAIPAVFTPHHYRGHTLVDGGLLNPVPVAPTLRSHADATIVIDVNGPEDRQLPIEQIDTSDNTTTSFLQRLREQVGHGEGRGLSAETGMALSGVLARSLDIMQDVITRQHLAVYRPDLIIRIPKNTCMIHEFYRARPVIELGSRLASEALDAWER